MRVSFLFVLSRHSKEYASQMNECRQGFYSTGFYKRSQTNDERTNMPTNMSVSSKTSKRTKRTSVRRGDVGLTLVVSVSGRRKRSRRESLFGSKLCFVVFVHAFFELTDKVLTLSPIFMVSHAHLQI